MHVVRPPAHPSGALVAWGNAWLTGHVGLDEAADAIERAAGPHVIRCGPHVVSEATDMPGVPLGIEEVPLRRGLADLRVAGVTALRLALPIPGDLLGLTGPPVFNSAALEAGEAAIGVLSDRAIGLIPGEDRRGSSYVGVRWVVLEASASVPDTPSLSDADHQLTMAVRDATDALLTVDDVSGWRPEIAEALASLRAHPEFSDTLAPGYPPRAHRVAALAGRLAVVVDLARGLNGQHLTADQMARRADAFCLLDRAVRRARVAAHNCAFDPVR